MDERASAIEDYAMIGDCHTAALIGTDGSVDWLCLPRFDSASTFGALLGSPENGRWRVRPAGAERCTSRRYDGDTFTLVTRWETADGVVEVIDCMPMGGRRADVIRRIRGVAGTVRIEEELLIRFDYSAAVPWVRQLPEGDGVALLAVAGPDSVIRRGPRLHADDFAHRATYEVSAGETVDLVLTWFPSHRTAPSAPDVDAVLAATAEWWTDWAQRIEDAGTHSALVRRSLLVLRALTHEDTGGIVAAATTSLPEDPGGSRNWDYRYVWLRDASLTLQALMLHGFRSEAEHWRSWLLRAIAGDPEDVQIMYGLAGERRLPEWTVESLPGHGGAAPVRVGNGASGQFQGDVFGEIMLALEQARIIGLDESPTSWSLQLALLARLERSIDRPDHGIWEIRGVPQRFTHSRVMMWAAFDCGVRAVEEHGLDGPVAHWRELRARLREEIETHGWSDEAGSFVQYYGGTELDAALLTLPQVGFLAADDERMLATTAAIERDLMHHGFLLRYRTEHGVDGLPGDENAFLACSFWLVQQYAASGRLADAVALMERLAGVANDVGLLAEEFDPVARHFAGNHPQAFSHLALVRAADAIAHARRAEESGPARLEERD